LQKVLKTHIESNFETHKWLSQIDEGAIGLLQAIKEDLCFEEHEIPQKAKDWKAKVI
jgi:hypothetical protein